MLLVILLIISYTFLILQYELNVGRGRMALFSKAPLFQETQSCVFASPYLCLLWAVVVKWKLWYAAWFHCSHRCGMTLKALEWKKTSIKSLAFLSRGYTQEGEGAVGRGKLGLCLPNHNSMFVIEETHTLLKLSWLEENYF